jgi:hypothetical protein
LNLNLNMAMTMRQIPFVPLSVPSQHLTGLYFGIGDGVAFQGLFDSGSDSVMLPSFVARDANIDLTYRKVGVLHRYGNTFVKYHAPVEVVDGPSVVTTVNVGDFLPALVPPQIYTPHWSIEFTARGVRFLPKRVGALPFKPAYDSHGRPDFSIQLLDFAITGEPGTTFEAVLDSGTNDAASLSHTTARQIGIERFPRGPSIKHDDPHDIHKYDLGLYYLPLTLGGFSFVMPTEVWSEHTSIIPAELLLAQGFRIVLSETSIDFTRGRM